MKIVFSSSIEKRKAHSPAWYLLGESNDMNVLKDPSMLKRLNDINSFPTKAREHILYALDAMIKNAKLKSISE